MSAFQLSNIPYILLSLNNRGEIMDINEYGADMLEYTKEEMIGLNWFDHFIDEKEKDNIQQVTLHILNGQLKDCDNQSNYILTKSGNRLLINWKKYCNTRQKQ